MFFAIKIVCHLCAKWQLNFGSMCVCGCACVFVCGGGIRIMCQISLFDISMSKYLHKYEQEYEDV